MENENYYEQLPEDYKLDYTIDANGGKTVVLMNIAAIVIWFAFIAVALLIRRIDFGEIDFGIEYLLYFFGFFVSYVAYMVLHELVHGLFYKIFTKRKLKFGFNFFVAYCGVPDIYVKKTPMIVTVLAPFVVFTLIGLPALFFVSDVRLFIALSALVGAHIGGCVGDLFVAIILIFKYRGKNIYVNDTGPKQTFYVKSAPID